MNELKKICEFARANLAHFKAPAQSATPLTSPEARPTPWSLCTTACHGRATLYFSTLGTASFSAGWEVPVRNILAETLLVAFFDLLALNLHSVFIWFDRRPKFARVNLSELGTKD